MKNSAIYFIRGLVQTNKGILFHIPVITVCIAESDVGGQYVRGVAICSAKDNPCKKTGINQAVKMAKKADSVLRGACAKEIMTGQFIKSPDGVSGLDIFGNALQAKNARPINYDSDRMKAVLNRFTLHSAKNSMPMFKSSSFSAYGLTEFEKELLNRQQEGIKNKIQ